MSDLSFVLLKKQLKNYLSTNQIQSISKAYSVAKKLHKGQVRYNGDPYITHPVAVASILADMRMDYQSIMAAILHDVLEDTAANKDELIDLFGSTVVELVDAVSKLKHIKCNSREEAQAENLRKMMLAMAKDIRVILVKLADRLHNMRTLGVLPREKQKRISLETLEIYAPIANRLGMNNLCVEFEELGFAHLYPIRCRVLKESLFKIRSNRNNAVKDMEAAIKQRCKQENIVPQKIYGREKHLYSLYKKMRDKDLTFSEIMDVYAMRIVAKDEDTCYRLLGTVHQLFKPVYGRFKDYIALPKANGYQSLHTTVLGAHGTPVEIQIRTEDMDKMAENGIASHWLYKSFPNDFRKHAKEWLNNIVEIQKYVGSSLEFVEHVKVDLYPDEVYVFTPTGDIMSLPGGSTCVDFAYAVHTDIGDACIAATIDKRLVPVSTKLSSGQTIEILTANGASPNPAWLTFVTTVKARSNIRYWLKNQHNHESIKFGKRLLEQSLLELSEKLENISEDKFEALCKELNFADKQELFADIGIGNQIVPLIARKLLGYIPKMGINDLPLAIKGTEGVVITYAKCCYPIPGDLIIGLFSPGKGMIIHRENCKQLSNTSYSPNRYIFVTWSNSVMGLFLVELRVEVANKKGTLAAIAGALADCNINIKNVHIDDNYIRSSLYSFTVEVNNKTHLDSAIKKLISINFVTKVSRVNHTNTK